MQTTELIALLRAPETVPQLSGEVWNAVVVQARRSQILGQMAALLVRTGHWPGVPAAVQRHLHLELLSSQRRGDSALWELGVMRRAVDPGIGLTVLKGCAYLAAGDINSQGRTFSDVDILVARSQLAQAELELMVAGWKPSKVDAYDAHYYRDWMHEVPPMEHLRRRTVVDLHHAINPPISRIYVDPRLLQVDVQLLGTGFGNGLFALSPLDRVIHCALHLIQEGESKKLLRDLYDLHLLVQQHCATPQLVAALLLRATELKVEPAVQSALGAATAIFAAPGMATKTRGGLLHTALVAAAQNSLNKQSVRGALASWWLLAYSHWIKMPLRILLPHLLRKWYKNTFQNTDKTP